MLFPYLNGDDLNSPAGPVAEPMGHQLPRLAARSRVGPTTTSTSSGGLPRCLTIVEEKVKPARRIGIKSRSRSTGRFWWQFGEAVPNLHERSPSFEKVLVNAPRPASITGIFRSLRHESVTMISCHSSFGHAAAVFAVLPVLQSCTMDGHSRYGSTLRDEAEVHDRRDCFEPFPFPPSIRSTWNAIWRRAITVLALE